jgi:hypothetical protein
VSVLRRGLMMGWVLTLPSCGRTGCIINLFSLCFTVTHLFIRLIVASGQTWHVDPWSLGLGPKTPVLTALTLRLTQRKTAVVKFSTRWSVHSWPGWAEGQKEVVGGEEPITSQFLPQARETPGIWNPKPEFKRQTLRFLTAPTLGHLLKLPGP